MLGIQKRLVGSYLIVILITVLILELFLIFFVRYYYYHNIERIMMNQAELSATFFNQYFADEDLEKQSERLLKGFSQHSTAQVQIIGSSGQLLQDSTGLRADVHETAFQDVQEAFSGHTGSWRGYDPLTHEAILAVSYPLQANDTIVGVVRFITSLTDTNTTVNQISAIFIAAGLVVVVIVAVLGILVSRTITGPITELKLAAEKMAEGDFTVSVRKRYQDELGTLADILTMMAAKIRRNERLKNDFISSVSHELRTPLTSIKGWAITLKSDSEDGKVDLMEGLDIIEAESDRLTRLVDELLDFSKIDNGRLMLSCAPLQIGDLLHHIGKQLAPRAARQGISLEVQTDAPLPLLQADENRLKQVLINLIDNALKFTEPGGAIKLHACSTQEQIMITVEDTGSGIAEQDLEHVFQKFFKGSSHTPGSGIGLSISEQIIKLHGGQLKIDSRVGKGTIVEIRIPV
ncbi:HAMP domain-containing protein [Paenibacillus sp. LMG 31456]|uniref:histidine kinase n=1 Tax=Paenibacillus foliorum TaxID=2654974 RepID=A0A972GPL4_9BACL|nr:HAMP domain-containing sensor histidine kinase [Paenibacillus foliorum]NOU94571.1 HAMP domain-containing protein [Paenibacillus foliorum]